MEKVKAVVEERLLLEAQAFVRELKKIPFQKIGQDVEEALKVFERAVKRKDPKGVTAHTLWITSSVRNARSLRNNKVLQTCCAKLLIARRDYLDML